jgi:hypothetical protein
VAKVEERLYLTRIYFSEADDEDEDEDDLERVARPDGLTELE